MNKSLMAYILSLLSIFVFSSFLYAKGDFSITSKVDKTKLNLDEIVTLTVTIEGDFKRAPFIKLPSLNEFDMVASSSAYNFSLGAKGLSSIYSLKYILKPKVEGKIIIGPAEANYQSKVYKTEPIEIEITAGAKEAPEKLKPPHQEEVPERKPFENTEKITL